MRSFGLVVLGVLVVGGLGAGAERKAENGRVGPWGLTSYVDKFEGAKRAATIVVGDGDTYLGLYVFDRWGNCVARDDYSGFPAARDDLAVEWFPPDPGNYTIDIHNFGQSTNVFTIAIR